MTPLIAQEIRGNGATWLLPIQDDDMIDLVRRAEAIGHFIGVNVNGIYSKERRFLNRRWSAMVCDSTSAFFEITFLYV